MFRGPFTYRRASKYGVYGSRNELASAGTFPGLSFRDHFTGKFIDDFNKIGIDIHDPRFGIFLDAQMHKKGAHIYNEKWKEFWDRNSSPTQSEVFDYAKSLMKEIYGTDVF